MWRRRLRHASLVAEVERGGLAPAWIARQHMTPRFIEPKF